MRSLRNRVHALADVAFPLDDALRGVPGREATLERRLRALGTALAEALASAPAVDIVAEEAARRIAVRGGRLRIAALARSLGVSERTLERRFDDAVGLSPRRLARVLRFRRAWEAASRAQVEAWSLLALDCGYSDQPHLIREFRRLAGTPPGRARSPGVQA
jgi:AraC-like DNA-binding protein